MTTHLSGPRVAPKAITYRAVKTIDSADTSTRKATVMQTGQGASSKRWEDVDEVDNKRSDARIRDTSVSEDTAGVRQPVACGTAGKTTTFDKANKEAERNIKPNLILYTSVLVALLQPFQSGWSTSQTNLTQYNDTAECNARPVAEDTCLMFPGHSKLEWTFAVNAWIFGGMIGSLFCGHFSDLWGRKKLLFVNCAFIIVGAVVQAAVSNIWAFAAGRVISGIASGVATGTLGSYINELSPPHLRNILGLGLQISVTMGIVLPAIAFFFANTSSGWRYLAGFPIILAALFLVLAPKMCLESPAWLLMKNRRAEAKAVIAQLYGEENVQTALNWLESSSKANQSELGEVSNEAEVKESLFSPRYRMQLAAAILLSCAQQLSGINAVFYYSSSIFADAGISDSRIGTLIIDFINIFPGFGAGALAIRFGNRQMILWGIASMCIMAICMTIAFLVDVSALSIVFTALYVIAFGATLGPLVWVVTADLFPDSIRASGSSLCIGINWLCNLIVGVAYPYISDALDDYAYLPFVVLLVIFYLLALKLIPETAGKSSEEIQAEFALASDSVELWLKKRESLFYWLQNKRNLMPKAQFKWTDDSPGPFYEGSVDSDGALQSTEC